ncbi:MAG: SWF/SNF helicase family protein [Dehalococcoidia bacterium]|nr:SWF/SNF helicase family protein [Dehalococcoidia bacterium]
MQVPPLPEDRLYPKERALVDLVAAERLAGRRVLVYATHTGTRDITGRMEDFLSRHGFRVAVMKADAVPPERREAWVAKRVEEGVDVLVCHPRLVQTGLDLVEFPTITWYETDYSVYTMRQASRRSWRIGQREPVQVVFMAYRNTLQADALKLVAQKLQSSLAVEGDLPEDGLAAYGDDGDDLLIALARKIVAGEEDAGSVESVFEQARQVAAEAEALLVDESWHAPEPEPVPVAVASGADGHGEDAPEPQRTLFSWAEFMAGEPDEPPKRKRRDEAPTLSLFEWALEQEQEGALAA